MKKTIICLFALCALFTSCQPADIVCMFEDDPVTLAEEVQDLKRQGYDLGDICSAFNAATDMECELIEMYFNM